MARRVGRTRAADRRAPERADDLLRHDQRPPQHRRARGRQVTRRVAGTARRERLSRGALQALLAGPTAARRDARSRSRRRATRTVGPRDRRQHRSYRLRRWPMRALLVMLAACASPFASDIPAEPADGKPDDGTRRIPWSVSRHAFPTDDRVVVSRDLALIAELGAKYVRTDLWWYSVEPQRGVFDGNALGFYDWFVRSEERRVGKECRSRRW